MFVKAKSKTQTHVRKKKNPQTDTIKYYITGNYRRYLLNKKLSPCGFLFFVCLLFVVVCCCLLFGGADGQIHPTFYPSLWHLLIV